MKASFIQKCSFALALAVAPFLAGCDQDSAGAATANDPTNIQAAQAQPASADSTATDTNVITDDSVATNADANLENAEGKLISTPETASTNVSNNPQLTDFTKLVQAGVGESVLLAYVTNSPSAFNVSSDDILYLNDLGTPESVISAMLRKDQQYGAGGVTAPATPPTTPETTATATAQTPMPGEPGGGPAPTPDTTAMVQTPPLTPSADVEADVQQAPNASYSYFYDSLAPYGNWVDIAGYGPCWQPTVVVVNPGWTPYSDRGHWAYTDCGWCWVSDYSWGWAPFHYGRWFRNSHYGWCWAPDTVWGPAWVSWRYSDAYCGWAPLPPSACYRPGFGFTYYGRSVGFGFTFGLGASRFTFVSINHFHDRNPGRYRVDHREVTRIYNTTIINNQIIRGRNNTLINRGIPVNRVAAATHTDIRPIRIQADANGPRSPQLGRDGRSLSVYRPALPTPKTAVAPRLVGEGVKPAPQFNLHSRVERTQNQAPRNQVERNPAMNNTPGSRPIIGVPHENRPADNVARDNRDNRASQPGAQNPNSLIMRGANRPDRQNNPARDGNVSQTPPNTPGRGQQFQPAAPNQNQPDRGDNNRRIVTPPLTPNQNQNDAARQNRDQQNQNITQPTVNRGIERQQQQQQMQEQRQAQQQQMQEQRQQQQQQQQQQRILQQQQRDVQQRQFQPPVTPAPRQEAPARSFDAPRFQQPADNTPPVRAESPRMQESRPAPAQEFRSAPPQQQFSAPAPRQESGGGGGGGRGGDGGGGRGNGGGGNGNDGGGRQGRGR
ncbi:MAG TPA: DUF6600 domain-containing protein [Verrucomicrobiae bacterium]|nr:DUF6600 domain-containing protein [Verrucomicrobiae bacterium]